MCACIKELLKETGSQGVLASIVSWVTSSSNAPPVLWDIKVRKCFTEKGFHICWVNLRIQECD